MPNNAYRKAMSTNKRLKYPRRYFFSLMGWVKPGMPWWRMKAYTNTGIAATHPLKLKWNTISFIVRVSLYSTVQFIASSAVGNSALQSVIVSPLNKYAKQYTMMAPRVKNRNRPSPSWTIACSFKSKSESGMTRTANSMRQNQYAWRQWPGWKEGNNLLRKSVSEHSSNEPKFSGRLTLQAVPTTVEYERQANELYIENMIRYVIFSQRPTNTSHNSLGSNLRSNDM